VWLSSFLGQSNRHNQHLMKSSPAKPAQKFHLVHVVHPTSHGPMGYREVIETIRWGLAELGCDVTVAFNTFVADRTNICFGGQMLAAEHLERIPPDTIFYHLEQIAHLQVDKLGPSHPIIASRFRIWEYSPANIVTWQKLNPVFAPQLLPICWSPNLRQIPKLDDEDIDVLFYGLPSAARLTLFGHLCQAEMKCVYACGLYGHARDSLIARAKIILNLNLFESTQIFEIVRVSYLLANEKAVVSDVYPNSTIDPDIREAVAFTPVEKITAQCLRLSKDDSARRQLAARGRAIFERRDIRENLRRVLAAG
jgi:hypothetical protein